MKWFGKSEVFKLKPIIDIKFMKTEVRMPDGRYQDGEPILMFKREVEGPWEKPWSDYQTVSLPLQEKKKN